MNVNNFCVHEQKNYILQLVTNKDGTQELREVKKGFWTWLDAHFFNRNSYKLLKIVTYVNINKYQIIFNNAEKRANFYWALNEKIIKHKSIHNDPLLEEQRKKIEHTLKSLAVK